MLENQNINLANDSEGQDASKVLIKLAKETEDLASKEKDIFSPILKKFQPIASGVAAVTLHVCYGTVLKQYLTCDKSSNTNETILVLQRAGKLEKALLQLVVEGSSECEDGGRTIVREVAPYEVDSIILRLLNQWIQDRLGKGRELADSAVEIVAFARECVESFLSIPVNVSDNIVYELAEGLESIFRDYITFTASCGNNFFIPHTHTFITILHILICRFVLAYICRIKTQFPPKAPSSNTLQRRLKVPQTLEKSSLQHRNGYR